MSEQKYIKYKKVISIIGWVIMIAGFILSPKVVGFLFTGDGNIETRSFAKTIVYAQFLLICCGALLVGFKGQIAKIAPTKKDMVFLSVVLVIFALMLEGLARLWLFKLATPVQFANYALYEEVKLQNRRYGPHHYMDYFPTPNFRSLDGRSRHNAMGFRGREITTPKPEGVFRIAIVGGSTVYSTAVMDDNDTFSVLMEKILKEKYGYTHVEVINAGAASYNSWESLVDFQFRVLDTELDMVMIYHGTNDVHARFVNSKFYKGDDSGLRMIWTSPKRYFYENSVLLRIVNMKLKLLPYDRNELHYYLEAPTSKTKLIETGYNKTLEGTPMETLERNPPIYYRRNLNNMIAIAKENGVVPVLVTWAWSPHKNDYAATPHYIKGFEESNEVVKEVAQSHNVPLFDFASVMTQDPQYWSDGPHENEKGSVIKAELWAKYLDEQGLIPKG